MSIGKSFLKAVFQTFSFYTFDICWTLAPKSKLHWRFFARYMRGERLLVAEGLIAATPKEQTPRNSQVNVLFHVSTLESDTAVSTEGENW